jgi:hypothetical protein
MRLTARYSKGQMKIQQMAFVLIAIAVFFALVALIYLSVRIKGIESGTLELREEEAKEIVRKLSTTPEFYSNVCANCVDLDKVIALSESRAYEEFWELEYLAVERVYPVSDEKIEIVKRSENFGIPSSAFVSLCRWEGEKGYVKCEMGKIYASGKGLNE